MINYGLHYLDKEDIKSVIKVLKSKNLTQGKKVFEFENSLCNYFGAKYTCSLSSATSGLYLISQILEWKKRDIIFLSPLSFVAGANSIVRSGAFPNFIDIDNKTFNIDPNKLEYAIKKNKLDKIKAVIATDYSGVPCDWKALRFLANKYNFILINDNCHAMGSKYYNDTRYAIKYADLVVHSYHAVKNITTGEGGSVLTNNKKIFERLIKLRSHGIEREKKHLHKKWIYDLNEIGYNFRLTDIQASLGISQLEKLNNFVTKRRKIAKIYDNIFEKISHCNIPFDNKNFKSAYHLYPLQINFSALKKTKEKLMKFLLDRKINLQVHYIPTYRFKYYKKNLTLKLVAFQLQKIFTKMKYLFQFFSI